MDPPSGVYLHHSPNEKSTNKLSMKIIEPNDFPKPSSHARNLMQVQAVVL